MSARGLSLIVLAWNRWDLTRRALDSLLATDLGEADVLVVDNGSTDATAQALAPYAPRVRHLRLPHNLGFVRGNNAGIAAVDPAHDVVLLNNDLEFPQRDWLTRLRACARGDVGIVGCRLVDGAGRLLHAGSLVLADDCRGVQIASGRVERDIGQYAGRDRRVQGVVFAAAYLRRETIAAIGPLHADYDTYFEDSDYCLRAATAGFATVLCGGVSLVHRQHGSTAADGERREALWRRGQSTFARHWRTSLRQAYRLHLSWHSALEFPPHYAAWSRPLLPALDRAGVGLRYASIYRDLPPPLQESGDSKDHVLNTIRARGAPDGRGIAVACAEPALFRHLRGRYRIGFGAVGATPEAAPWNALDEAWVATETEAERLREAGVAVPIRRIPRGVDLDYFHPQLRRLPPAQDERVFLLAADWTEAQRPWELLRAFSRAFRRREPVRLLAWLDPAGVDLCAAVRALALDAHGGRISYLLDRGLVAEQRGLAYRAADVFLAAAADERRLLEAMAVGLPVAAAAHPELEDLLRAAQAWRLPVQACEDAWIATLRELAAMPHAVLAQRGADASAQVSARRGWEHTAAAIVGHLQAIELDTLPRLPRRAVPVPRARVLVLGMHRSGTSCIAGALQAMGLYGGEAEEFLAQPDENPFGFFEHAGLHAACVQALARRGGDWSIPLGWTADAAAAATEVWRHDFAALRARLDRHGAWFMKEPRLCLLTAELGALVDDAIGVHVVRDPAAVARSIARRDGLSIAQALALWEHYQLAALRALPPGRLVRVDYARLKADPTRTLARLHADLAERGASGLRPLQPAECAAWVRADFDRSRHGAPLALPPAVAALWQLLRDDADFEVPPLSDASAALLRHLFAEHQAVRRREDHG